MVERHGECGRVPSHRSGWESTTRTVHFHGSLASLRPSDRRNRGGAEALSLADGVADVFGSNHPHGSEAHTICGARLARTGCSHLAVQHTSLTSDFCYRLRRGSYSTARCDSALLDQAVQRRLRDTELFFDVRHWGGGL